MMSFKPTFLILFLLFAQQATAQSISTKKAINRLHEILEKNKPMAEVMLLGTFHFAGEKVDEDTTPQNLRISMLSKERQYQIQQLVKKMSKFKPTRIAIEVSPAREKYYDSLYSEYRLGRKLTGKGIDTSDEVFQLGFRLAKMLDHEKVYPIDAQPFRFHLSPQDSVLTYQKFNNQEDTSYAYWDKKYESEKHLQDTLKFLLTLKQIFTVPKCTR